MANRNAILLRPQWVVNNYLTLPLVTQGTGKNSIRGLFQVIIPVTLFLDSLFDESAGTFKKRSLEDDQLQIFRAVETALATMGVDGRSCLLRTICEIQKNPIGEMTIIGEVLTVLLTPKRGINDFLHDYLEAERLGQTEEASQETCGSYYPKCPMSLFNLFKSWSTPEDKPAEPVYNNGVELQYMDGQPLDGETGRSDKVPIENHYLMHVN
ncbi:uncharacterized protein LOC136027890 isoform X4 [Artemia franciscana]|uniref:uncharacterized protein LOC136027890 isoform X4 n=1 Tax=Artemia franciscana TaxID=6661 RepID=UPI0032DA98A5